MTGRRKATQPKRLQLVRAQLKGLKDKLAEVKKESKQAQRALHESEKQKKGGLSTSGRRLRRTAPSAAAASSGATASSLSPLKEFPLFCVPVPKVQKKRGSPPVVDPDVARDLANPATYLITILKAMVHKLSVDQKFAFWVALKHVGNLEVGTVCSGTECPILVLKSLHEVAAAILEPLFGSKSEFRVSHVFSTEVEDEKRHFIHQHVASATHSFKDVEELSSETQQIIDRAAPGESKVKIPKVTMLVGGFPCTDVANMNKNRSQNDRVVWDCKGKTGRTFFNICRYIEEHPPIMCLFENVKGLAKLPKNAITGEVGTIHDSNLGATLQILQDMAKQVGFAFLLDPRMYGHLQSRPRLYMPTFLKSALSELGIDPAELYNCIASILELISSEGYGHVSLEAHLLPNDHPAVAKHSAEVLAAARESRASAKADGAAAAASAVAVVKDLPVKEALAKGPSEDLEDTPPTPACRGRGGRGRGKDRGPGRGPTRGKGGKGQGRGCVMTDKKLSKMATAMKWPAKHDEVARSKGIDWASQHFSISDEALTKYPGLGALSDREADCLAVRGVRFSEKVLRGVEVGQSLGRAAISSIDDSVSDGSGKARSLGCVTPRMRLWLTSLNRLNHGMEALNMMGIHYGAKHEDLVGSRSGLLSDLAGNAFHSGCCGGIMVAMMTGFGECLVKAQQLVPRGVGAGDGDNSSKNSEDEDVTMSAADAEATLDALWDPQTLGGVVVSRSESVSSDLLQQ